MTKIMKSIKVNGQRYGDQTKLKDKYEVKTKSKNLKERFS